MKAVATLLLGMAVQTAGYIAFADNVGDHMVLQQAPSKAGIFGSLNTTSLMGTEPTVTATVIPVGGSPYEVPAKLTNNSNNWVAYLRPTPAGGNYTIKVTCTGCAPEGPNTIEMSDVTFGDVWYCGGQSNMALPLSHTLSRNDSLKAIQAGQFSNIRIYQMNSNMNEPISWGTLLNATQIPIRHSHNLFFSFSSTCYYFGQELTRMMGDKAPPIGLINTAFGGSRAAQWTPNATSIQCGNVTIKGTSQRFFDDRVMPFSQMSIKGFVWYQGENDMGNVFGNSKYSTGYSCEIPKMVGAWRSAFSKEPNTTSPDAPFGLVTLASSGGEGHPDIGGMYFAQTGSYGDIPNAVFPNTFLAHAYDLADPFSNTTCYKIGCCETPPNPTKDCHGCEAFCASGAATGFYMSAIHPRNKLPVGQRLAQACYGTVYEPGKVAVKGPVISGCSVSNGILTVKFNEKMLNGDHVVVDSYQRGNNASMLQVLTNSTLFCLQTGTTTVPGSAVCLDNGYGKSVFYEKAPLFNSLKTWPMVNIEVASATTITADVSDYGEIFGIRYAFFEGENNGCCGLNNRTSGPCPQASCPLKSTSGLPATPFVAHVVNGKCKCISPQVCDE
eukprot:TRINITY_DN7554_c0_g1_i2.p1 TRINITY_DN7554_c0_g1~~TRINITY_DN7554_c0_g1_i2.p1  ORF type:complete len:611 (+),score=131.20 TRINITY_DN7554_c0_g1_i2:60-1892(+)